jgi:signal transduction histidine kinase
MRSSYWVWPHGGCGGPTSEEAGTLVTVGIWTPAEEPGSRQPRSWLFDAVVALFALLAASAYVTSSPDLSTTAAAAIILATAVPLVVRRVWPVPVFAWALLVAAATGWWAMQVVWSPALVIGLYTVAVLRPRRDAVIAAVLLAAGAVASSIHVFPSTWIPPAASLVAVVAAATVLGLYIRTRRALLDQLRERAQRLEHDREQELALAAAEERTRIAREMHDIVAHHLTVMVTLSDGAAAKAASAPEQAADVMRTVSATGRLALTDTRRLLGVLRDRDDDVAARAPLPDVAGLDELIDRVRTAGLPVRYDVEGAPPAGAAAVQLALYRIVQESLTNTMKHAGPGATAAVRIRYGRDEVCVEVADDGIGGTSIGGPRNRSTTGRGLVGMRERVEAFAGDVRSGPRTPRGWLVTARLSVSEELAS